MKYLIRYISRHLIPIVFGVLVIASPLVSFAQTPSNNQRSYCAGFNGSLNLDSKKTISDVLKFGTCFIQESIIPLLFAVAVLFFIYGVVNFIRASASGETKLEEKKEFMIWGIVALAVMTGVWGLVAIITNTFGIGNVIPQLPVNPQ
jgi:hypothetical protein